MRPMRVAFAGASGTGKSTLAGWLAAERGLPLNPVGSRSVAAQMGFSSPYDVDRAGRRREFQARLLAEKLAWEEEASPSGFVTDRTPLDLLAYLVMHDSGSLDAWYWNTAHAAMAQYDRIFYCPTSAFCDPAGDPQRMQSPAYHRAFDALLSGLLNGAWIRDEVQRYDTLNAPGLDARRKQVFARPARRADRLRPRGIAGGMADQVSRDQVARWLTRNGFRRLPRKATGHAYFVHESGVKVTLTMHGPRDVSKKHLGVIARVLADVGFDRERALEEIRAS